MSTTLQTIESMPEAVSGARSGWPEIHVVGLTYFDLDLVGREAVWQRIEQWIAWRWGERPCTFIVEGGGGTWRPPLVPFVVETAEAWGGEEWAAVTLAPHPLGDFELGAAPFYRFTGTLGSTDDPPPAVKEAVERMMRYFAVVGAPQAHGASRTEERRAEESYTLDRAPTWAARAIHNSGAADLLRPYRRAP